MSDVVHYELDDTVAIIRLDDGKANALGPDVIAGISKALDRAAGQAKAVLLTGREGKFSAGFNLKVLQSGGPAAGRQLVTAGAKLALQIARHPTPVVVGCTGHALAMGAVLLCAADVRIGARGDFKLGFNEVAIGMITPIFLLELARERVSKRHIYRASVAAEIYSPDDAVDAGLLDQAVSVDELPAAALAEAKRLGELPRGAFVGTRALLRGKTLDYIEATLEDDMSAAFPS